MLQRGRKSQATREILALVGRTPQLNRQAPSYDPPSPPKYLDAPEREAWNIIVREHDFNRAGHLLLENALRSLGRARKCREIIDRDGALLTRRDGLPKRHPLLNVEVQSRKLVHAIFKVLRINLGGELFDRTY
jgi:hypothetical protein